MIEQEELAQLIYDYLIKGDFYVNEEDPYKNWNEQQEGISELRQTSVDGSLDFKDFSRFLLVALGQDKPENRP